MIGGRFWKLAKLFEAMLGLNKKYLWQLDQQSLLDLREKNIKYLLEKCDSALAAFYSTTFMRDGS